ncbi:MAG: RES domain-containing protein, partial [Acidobacteriaceae bacterium]|nr:RES domain-containing protein [Acidobacteriaceae bacterium]
MSIEHTVHRSGFYYRVVAPNWVNPADTSYSKRQGGRWNPPGEFGALYLNADVHVAAANARAQHAGRALKLFDLLPEARP